MWILPSILCRSAHDPFQQSPVAFAKFTTLTSVYFSVQQVSNIDEKLYRNKIHDKISGSMLKLRGDSRNNLQQPFSKNVFNKIIFPNDCWKTDVVPIHKKMTKKCLLPSLQWR